MATPSICSYNFLSNWKSWFTHNICITPSIVECVIIYSKTFNFYSNHDTNINDLNLENDVENDVETSINVNLRKISDCRSFSDLKTLTGCRSFSHSVLTLILIFLVKCFN